MKVLVKINDSDMVSYKYDAIYRNDVKVFTFQMPLFTKLSARIRLLSRLFRLEPRCATCLSNGQLVIAFSNNVCIVDLNGHTLIDTFPVRKGWSNPLNFCTVDGDRGEMVLWGDYGMNPHNDEVNIYRYHGVGKPEIVYTFPKGTIKHVHNILNDKYRARFIVLTGDFGDKVGIYAADYDFKEVKALLVDEQRFRSVVGKVTRHGLIYATDAVMEEKHVFYMDFEKCDKEECYKIDEVLPLSGSVIYGQATPTGLLFSTTVEPRPSTGIKLIDYFDPRLGKGIKSRNVQVIHVTDDFETMSLFSFKKDMWPMRLLQYGQVEFATNIDSTSSTFWCNPMAVAGIDGKPFKISAYESFNCITEFLPRNWGSAVTNF